MRCLLIPTDLAAAEDAWGTGGEAEDTGEWTGHGQDDAWTWQWTEPPGLPPQYSKQAAQRPTEMGGSTAEAALRGRWTVLLNIPSFSVGAWECNVRLQAWWWQFQTISTTVSPGFGAYVQAEYAVAEERHQKRLAGHYNLPDLTPALAEHQEYENRLTLTLIRCLPQEVKQPVLEKTGSSKLRGVRLFWSVFVRNRCLEDSKR